MENTAMNFIRFPRLQAKTGHLGKTLIYDLMKRGILPMPIKIGRCSVWNETDVDAALTSLASRQALKRGKSA
jgi:predicted DNA-binding transcriptional regulator AlpA